MQVSTRKTVKQPSLGSSLFCQPNLNSALEWVRALTSLTGTALIISAILAFRQFLFQVYAARWQMALLFALISLMVALLLGQSLLGRSSIAAGSIRWSALSSLMVASFGIGIVICILNTAPPLV